MLCVAVAVCCTAVRSQCCVLLLLFAALQYVVSVVCCCCCLLHCSVLDDSSARDCLQCAVDMMFLNQYKEALAVLEPW